MQASIRWARRLAGMPARFARDVRGNVAMMFALTMPVMLLMTFAGVDIHRAASAKVQLQDALDAAALSAARSPYTAAVDIQRVGMAALRANLQSLPGITLNEAGTSFVLTDDDVVVGKAAGKVKAVVANIFLPPYGSLSDEEIEIGVGSEVDRSARNIEVALVLDVTGSMAGQRLTDLKKAARDLVDIVVQDEQSPFYSRVALVPYSMGVNLGGNAAAARGAYAGSTDITNAVINLAGSPVTITAATKDRPVRITAASHGFKDDDIVWITSATGMTQLNNKAYRVDRTGDNTFELYTLGGNRVDGRNYNSYTGSDGRVQRCQDNDCSITITSANHGLQNNDYVRITGVGGMSQINDKTFLVGNRTPNTYTIDPNAGALGVYTSGGKSWCAQEGCKYFAFDNMYDDLRTHEISSCVSERTGANAYTDEGPGSRVGRNYPGTTDPKQNGCVGSHITPMSSDKAQLKADIDTYVAEGSTAGQIGMAWGWYMVSPSFNSLWTGPGAAGYNTAETLKAVVIMTDGEFNTPYCKGVIAQNAGTGSGNNEWKINCDGSNGDPFAQGRALCTGMKNKGVVVYTVGFALASDSDAERMLRDCASTAANFYLPASGGDLSKAFAAIGRDITKLRISK